MQKKQRKPVAVLSDSVAHGLSYLLNINKNIVEYHSHLREITTRSGQKYYICTKPEHLLAIEISRVIVTPEAYNTPDFNYLYRLAISRIR